MGYLANKVLSTSTTVGTTTVFTAVPGLYIDVPATTDPVVAHFEASYVTAPSASTGQLVMFDLYDIMSSTPLSVSGGETGVIVYEKGNGFGKTINHTFGPFFLNGATRLQVFVASENNSSTDVTLYSGAVAFTPINAKVRLWAEDLAVDTGATPNF